VSRAHLVRPIERVASARRFRAAVAISSAAFVAVALLLVVRHFVVSGWPLDGGHPLVVAAVGVLLVLGYGLKALGWGRLFAPRERPRPLALAAAGGGASISGLVLPGRLDEVIRIAIVRRYPACPAGVTTLCLSLVTLGLLDAVALSPLATASAAFPGVSPLVRAGFAVVGAGGLAAAAVVVALPRLTASARLARLRLVRWLAPRATPLRRASHAWGLILAAWLVRVLALVLLLETLGLGFSIPLAVMFVCAGAASAAIPFGLAGAATQVGAGATLLAVSGVEASRALGFALAAQALVVLAGAAVFLFAIAWQTVLRLRAVRGVGVAGASP
jgi:hypothetical protein